MLDALCYITKAHCECWSYLTVAETVLKLLEILACTILLQKEKCVCGMHFG